MGIIAVDMTQEEVARAIWEVFKSTQKGDYVVRSGFGLCGCYKEYDPDAPIDYARKESDTEHAFGCEEIAKNIIRFCPRLFPMEEAERIYSLIRYHDIGEVDYGDKADDGSQNRAEKDTIELESFKKAVRPLPPYIRYQIIDDFSAFQEMSTGWKFNSKISVYRVAGFVKLCDKVHAPLRGAIYKMHGVGGSLAYKKEHFGSITTQDAYYASITGTYDLVENWTLHYINDFHAYPHFSIFFSILSEMMKDVNNGKPFAWIDAALDKLQIPAEHLYADWS